jgi:DNA-binding HxlR family transcriptional regulator
MLSPPIAIDAPLTSGSAGRGLTLDPMATNCPLSLAINTIGGRWKLQLLRALFLGGTRRYNHLLQQVDGISPKELTRNLRELEASRLVERQRAGYVLTALGFELLPTFQALGRFGHCLVEARASSAQG